MTTQDILGEIRRAFIEEAQSDVIGLWLIAQWVKDDLPSLDTIAARKATLDIIREALLQQRVVPGEFVDQDEHTLVFLQWGLPVDETVTRIEREWTALGRDLNPGDVVWFVDAHVLPVTARKHPMGKGWTPS
jgi:hypothetical protein